MTSLSFKAVCTKAVCTGVLLFLTLATPAYAKPDKVKVSIPPGVHLRGSIDTATGEYKTKTAFEIVDVELNYKKYRGRLQSLVSKLENDQKTLLEELKTLETESGTVDKRVQELETTRKTRIARIHALRRNKQLGSEYKILMGFLPKMSEDLFKERNKQSKINKKKADNDTRLVWIDKNLKTLQPLSQATSKSPQNERPTVEKIQIDRGPKTYFESHLRINEDAIKLLKMSIEEYGKRAKTYDDLAKTVQKQFDGIDSVRTKQVDIATKAQKKFVAAHNTLIDNIGTETWSRFWGNIAIDTVEVYTQGKTPVGIVFELSAKAVESLWVGDKGVTWRMYDPSALVGNYTNQARAIEAHWNDGYGLKTIGDEAKRFTINAVEEAALRFRDVRSYRKLAREHLQPALRKVANRQFLMENQEEILRRRVLNEFSQKAFKEKFAKDLGRAAAGGFKHKGLQKELASLASEITHHRAAMEELRKHVAKNAEKSAILKKVIGSHAKLLEKFSYKNLLLGNLPGVPSAGLSPDTQSGKAKMAKGVAAGMAFDALRGAYHTAGDMLAEAYWTNFLNEEMRVKGHLMDLRQTNLLWLALRSDLETYTHLSDYYEAFNAEAALLLQRYVSNKLGDEGMHVLKADIIKEGFGTVKVKITTRGSMIGHKVFLKGNLGHAELLQKEKVNSYNRITDEVIEAQIDNINTMKEWSYKLGGGKKLSDISKNGKLTLEIQML